MKTAPIRLIQLLNIAFLIAMVIFNYVPANRVTDDVSAGLDNYFTPAGYTFSIWGLIYLGLAAFCFYQSSEKPQRSTPAQNPGAIYWSQRIDVLFILSCILNMGWLWAWTHQYISFSVGIMLGYVAVLSIIYVRIQTLANGLDGRERLVVRMPFSINLGWACVAMAANVSAWLTGMGWDGFGLSDAFWFAAVSSILLALTLWVKFTFNDTAFVLTIVWAFVGLAVALQGKEGGFGLATIVAAVCAVVAAVSIPMKPMKAQPAPRETPQKPKEFAH